MADDKEKDTDPSDDLDVTDPSESFARVKIPRGLGDKNRRKGWGLPEDENVRGDYIVELNLQHIEGLTGAAETLKSLCEEIHVPRPRRVAKTYYSCYLKVADVRNLAIADEKQAKAAADEAQTRGERVGPSRYAAIFRVWPDFKVKTQIDASTATVKADAAVRAYAASGDGIVWAVLDSGIDYRHPHFGVLPPRKEAPPAEALPEVEGAADPESAKPATAETDPPPPDPVAGHTLLDDAVFSLHRSFYNRTKNDEYGQPIPDPLEDPDDLEEDEVTGDTPEKRRAARRELRRRRIDAHRRNALWDPFGHGTHVAGIVGGGLRRMTPKEGDPPEAVVFAREFRAEDETGGKVKKTYTTRHQSNAERLRGVAPNCKLVSLRVLDEKGTGRTSDVIRALEYIREQINDDPKMLRVHGVNLSVGYEFDAELFACGQSPVCAEVDRLVQAGVVVVTAAGNTGYGHVQATQRIAKVGLSNTINDPGNAALAITVGSTHRDSPHTYGVSYFSSKGPTGDGRLKPDLVAPGERITSCATGEKLDSAVPSSQQELGKFAYYVDDSGTSMAAPHVSGAIAAFLSIRREFIGKPQEVKRIFLESATPLGRERYFEGHGMLDLMRAIQSV